MLSRKIRIDSFISDEEKEEICQYSKSLSVIYNECLDLLKENLNFKELSKITKGKSKTTGLHSKHIQNTSREVINAVKAMHDLCEAVKKLDGQHQQTAFYACLAQMAKEMNW